LGEVSLSGAMDGKVRQGNAGQVRLWEVKHRLVWLGSAGKAG
jgi:hypothetical protein